MPPKKIEGRMTVQKTAEKFVILLETITEPSAFKDSVWQVSARDRTAGKWLALTRSDASIISSVEGKILRIEVSVPALLKRFGLDASPVSMSFFETWEVEEVASSEYAYLAISGEEKAAGYGRKNSEAGD
ncbi:hypothetical protein AGMMS50267_02050 [Spirochaetia bacterium]|nr:hypothetical protein AGMMS50267_02050 [Spirochaetia bacterium]